jgi:hypothetical protein
LAVGAGRVTVKFFVTVALSTVNVATPLPPVFGDALNAALADEFVLGVLEATEEPPTEMLMEAVRPAKPVRVPIELLAESLLRYPVMVICEFAWMEVELRLAVTTAYGVSTRVPWLEPPWTAAPSHPEVFAPVLQPQKFSLAVTAAFVVPVTAVL